VWVFCLKKFIVLQVFSWAINYCPTAKRTHFTMNDAYTAIMSSSLAAQLSQIAASSTSALNLKAQKLAHSKSLIFDPRVAASQSFDSIYTLCHEGFQELCLLDNRFLDFQRSLFSLQSQDQDRTQMTAADNEELNKRLETFLSLVGSRLRLNPAIKAVEWLVRRFRSVCFAPIHFE
jgi:U3 small nucleolar RNA-associated protein 10